MNNTIHSSAIVEKGAKLGKDVYIGPYCIVGEHVVLGDHVRLESHVVIQGRTTVGEGCQFFPFASIGHAPQDLKFHGEPSTLSIGKRCIVREYVTLQPGTEGGGMKTVIGDNCLFMASSHVAHDCTVGNNVILANNATLAGHVSLGDHVVVGGLSAIHQFVRVGSHAMIGGMSGIEHDVIPYGLTMGERASLAGLNLVGLKRRGFSREAIHSIRHSYQLLFEDESGTFAERLQKLEKAKEIAPEVQEILNFVKQGTDRAICQPVRSPKQVAA